MDGLWQLFNHRPEPGVHRFGYDTAENRRHQTEHRILENGDVQMTTTTPSGGKQVLVRSADGLVETSTAYGMSTVLSKVLDEKTQRPIPGELTLSAPSGLTSTTRFTNEYAENGADLSAYTLTVDSNDRISTAEVDGRTGVWRENYPDRGGNPGTCKNDSPKNYCPVGA